MMFKAFFKCKCNQLISNNPQKITNHGESTNYIIHQLGSFYCSWFTMMCVYDIS